MEYFYVALLIILFLLAFIILFRSNLKQQEKMQSFLNTNTKNLNQQLFDFQNTILQNVKSDLNNLNHNTLFNISDVKNTVSKGLLEGFEKTNLAFNEMSKQLVSIDSTQKNLDEISQNIVELQSILTDKKTRGIYGEIELYSILKMVYGLNDKAYQKQFKLSNNKIADAVIFAPSPLNKIVVDSKFPLENYLRLNDNNLSALQRNSAEKQFIKDIKTHIDDIKNKYIIPNETAEMAYMFIPAEAIFSDIYAKYDQLVLYSYQHKVFMVSPTTLMAYITAIKTIYLGVKQNEQVDKIQLEFKNLATEFDRFENRFSSLVNEFERVYKSMHSVNITTNKIINRFKDIQSVNLDKESVNEKEQISME